MTSSREQVPLRVLNQVPKGSTFTIVAPASFARDERLDLGASGLRAIGFDVAFAENARTHGPLYFAGDPAQRLSDLRAAFEDESTKAVMCVRGGYGSNYLLDGLDIDVFRRNPKPFFAYSDLSGIQTRLLDELGIPSLHGPMLAADFYREDGVHLPSFTSALAGEPYVVGTSEGMRTLKPGAARGILYGGCLSILVSLLGTPWEPETEGKLLFLEDTGAKPYQIDRMLWQLRRAGKFEGVSGIVFGEMLDCKSPGTEPDYLEKVITYVLDDFDGPIAFGLRSGHVSRQNVTLTLGVAATLQAGDSAELQLLEPAVAP